MARKKTNTEIVDDKSDIKDKSDNKFRKVFVIQALRTAVTDLTENEDYHVNNKAAVIQEAMLRGLHCKSRPEVESVEVINEASAGNSVSIQITYSVDVVPASADYDPANSELPIDREDDKRERVRQSRLRAGADPEGFDAA